MQTFSFLTLLAVFEEMFGRGLFWTMVALSAIFGLLFLSILIRERRLESRLFVRAQLLSPLGAMAAVAFVQWMANSHLYHIGGAIDVIVLIAIAVIGAAGTTLVAYAAQALALSFLRR
ncbi:DUF5368 domain-containing protein (plasmid) [Cereibacter azotoformans]|uniref:DUF5368 domain-containing protein n=1 Tax=Cereibacter azotoformans TaxID=43057 RepID=UPI000E359992|nr:DUF5368 domain-containing protein [Cereibacter azotoformans]AXQ96016.1 hypothetical protein D0Z66_19885 [Cereibacter sphaeroides]UIJ33087.1 DUF5368 domain-containing protein [Cereibacter azotoformans]